MNFLQYFAFLVYVFSTLLAGIWLSSWIQKGSITSSLNRFTYLGETFLLGSIILVGEMLVFSMIGLYHASFLWGIVVANYLLLFSRDIREKIRQQIFRKISWDFTLVVFLLLLLFFAFRNSFFMLDVDDHSNYLFTQKLWLSTGTSLQGDAARNLVIFLPRFDSMPYGLGIALFGQEALFPQLVNLWWRVIVLFLVFGYTSYRFNRTYGLAASMLVLFNDHFYFSGVNPFVTINGAIAALFFTMAYNFWESREQKNTYRFVLAIIFATQIMGNKFQMAYAMVLLAIFGLIIQIDYSRLLREIFRDRRYLIGIFVASAVTGLWFLKNYLITGVPTFPVFAGKLSGLGWSPAYEQAFMEIYPGLAVGTTLKYLNYLFIWPGIQPAKYVILALTLLPFLYVLWVLRNTFEKNESLFWSYWLGMSILVMTGICMGAHWDPRYYRYGIAIFSFAAVVSFHVILRYIVGLRRALWVSILILGLALPGYKIMFQENGSFKIPTMKDNAQVLLNKIHMPDIMEKYFPDTLIARNALGQDEKRMVNAAWAIEPGGVTPLSAFLLPIKPQTGLWNTSVIRWESYPDPELIVKDLRNHGIETVLRMEEGQLRFLSPEEYAMRAVKYNRNPKTIFYSYQLPSELIEIKK